MTQHTTFWWIMASDAELKAKDFIETLTSRQMKKLEAVFSIIPDSRFIIELITGAMTTEEMMCRENWTREDIQHIEADVLGVFACTLLKAFKKRLNDTKELTEKWERL